MKKIAVRNIHRAAAGDIANACVDDEALDAPGHCQRSQQIAEHAVFILIAYADNQNITLLAKFHSHMQHPVVARVIQDGDRASRDSCTRIDRAHRRLHQTVAPLCFVNGRDPE